MMSSKRFSKRRPDVVAECFGGCAGGKTGAGVDSAAAGVLVLATALRLPLAPSLTDSALVALRAAALEMGLKPNANSPLCLGVGATCSAGEGGVSNTAFVSSSMSVDCDGSSSWFEFTIGVSSFAKVRSIWLLIVLGLARLTDTVPLASLSGAVDAGTLGLGASSGSVTVGLALSPSCPVALALPA